MTIIDLANTKKSFKIDYFTDLECYRTNIDDVVDLNKYYTYENYQSHHQNEKGIFNKLYKIAQSYNLNYKFNLIKKTSLTGKKILDYGCGVGDFILKMKKENWEAIGYEPNKKAQEILKQKQIKIINSIDEVEDESLDIITLWHVLEHTNNPLDTIIELKRKLKKTGKLITAVPNYNSYDAKFYKTFWEAPDVPRHIYHFQRKSFDMIANKTGLNLIQTKPLWLDALYVSILSEKNKSATNSLKAIIIGFVSNFISIFTKEYSSVIYFFEKGK